MKIGFTGTQTGMSQHQKEQFVLKLFELGITEFHHGDCVGADAEAHDIVREFFPVAKIETHPCNITSKRAFKKADVVHLVKPPLDRNKDIVDATDLLIGAPKEDTEVLRSGTWSTIRYARKINKIGKVLER
jgi:hypothetical protein